MNAYKPGGNGDITPMVETEETGEESGGNRQGWAGGWGGGWQGGMGGGWHRPQPWNPYNGPYRTPCYITDCPKPGQTQPHGPPPTLPSPGPSPWWG